MKRQWIGAIWALAGISLFAWGAKGLVELAADPQYGWNSTFYEPSWWYVQIGMELFVLACGVIGLGVMSGKRWGHWGLKIVGPLALLYLVAYDIFGGERAWWLAVGALVLTIFVGVSVYYAYRQGDGFAA